MNKIDVRSGVRRVAQAAPIGGLMAGMLLAAAGFAAALAPQRGTYLGPHQGETLTSWTQRWLEGPVQYIATPDEKEIYGALESTTQRLQFIRLFWERRDPIQRSRDNEFLDEFVRRVEYAEQQYGNGRPGWETVFGRVVLTLGPPDRVERDIGLPREISWRPAILWTYDKRIPEYPVNEKLMFVFTRGRWRLAPPSNFAEIPSVTTQARDFERFNQLTELPNDFERTMQTVRNQSLVQPVRYSDVVNNIEADVVFPDVEISFAWTAAYEPGAGEEVDITLTLTWRMESLVFHAVDEQFQTEMVIYAVLFDDEGEPVTETSDHVSVTVAVDEIESRIDELVERTISLSARPGSYRLTLSLDDHLLGYRSVHSNNLVVPSG